MHTHSHITHTNTHHTSHTHTHTHTHTSHTHITHSHITHTHILPHTLSYTHTHARAHKVRIFWQCCIVLTKLVAFLFFSLICFLSHLLYDSIPQKKNKPLPFWSPFWKTDSRRFWNCKGHLGNIWLKGSLLRGWFVKYLEHCFPIFFKSIADHKSHFSDGPSEVRGTILFGKHWSWLFKKRSKKDRNKQIRS